MGLCGSNLTQDEREELNLSKQIEQAQNQDFDEYRSKIRLLLLGAGESGSFSPSLFALISSSSQENRRFLSR